MKIILFIYLFKFYIYIYIYTNLWFTLQYSRCTLIEEEEQKQQLSR